MIKIKKTTHNILAIFMIMAFLSLNLLYFEKNVVNAANYLWNMDIDGEYTINGKIHIDSDLGEAKLTDKFHQYIAKYNDYSIRDYVVSDDETRVYSITTNGTFVILDISNLNSISEVGNYTISNLVDISLSNDENKVYITRGIYGLTILDISNPANITELGSYDGTVDNSTKFSLSNDESRIYIANGNVGISILDISNPANITELGTYNTVSFAKDIVLSSDNSTAYVADGLNGLVILNIVNPASVSEIGNYNTTGNAEGVKLSNDGTKVYVADSSAGLVVLDISDLNNIVVLGTYSTDYSFTDLLLSSDESKIYIANDKNLLTLDISDLSNIIKISENDNVYNTQRVPAISADGSKIYALGSWRIFVIKENIKYKKNIFDAAYVHWIQKNDIDFSIDKTKLFLSRHGSGINSYDITDLNNMTYLGGYNTPGASFGIDYASGDRLFVADYGSGIRVIDVQNPSSMTEIGFFDTVGGAMDVVLSSDETKAYVADDNNGLVILDVTNPVSISELGNYNTTGFAKKVILSSDETKAYIADGTNGLVVLDVTNPASITEIGNFNTNLESIELLLSSDETKIYVVSAVNELLILDISNLANITELARYQNGKDIVDVEMSATDSNILYLASNSDGINAINVSNPASIVEVYETPLGNVKIIKNHQNNGDAVIISENNIFSINLNQFSKGDAHLNTNNSINYVSTLETFSETLGSGSVGTVSYQISSDNGTNWFYWNGTAWVATTLIDGNETSSATDINNNISSFGGGSGNFLWKSYFNSNGFQEVNLSQVSINYDSSVNNPPIITSNGGSATAAISIAEGQTLVATVTATDPNNGDIITYSISGGIDQNQFNINSNSGVLTFQNAPYYNNPGDSNSDNVYEVTVRASDNGALFDEQAISVTVTEVPAANNPPTDIILTETFVSDSKVMGDLVGTLISTDLDSSDIHSYNLITGIGAEDNSFFNINSNQLLLNFNPSYHSPVDNGDVVGNNTYSIRVESNDGNGGTYQKSFIITVTDQNKVILGRSQSINSGIYYTRNKRTCKDARAFNFSRRGIHDERVCVYPWGWGGNDQVSKVKIKEKICENNMVLFQKLKEGDEGEGNDNEIKKLKNYLKILGLYNGEVDGVYDSEVTESVVKLQKILEIEETGEVDRGLIFEMYYACGQT